MPVIQAESANGTQDIEAEAGRKLVLVLKDAGIDILHRCGGNAKCTTCRVEVLGGDPGEIGEPERARLALETGLAENIRLSCQMRVKDDLKVRVLRQVTPELAAGTRPSED
jgi:ferredoxin